MTQFKWIHPRYVRYVSLAPAPPHIRYINIWKSINVMYCVKRLKKENHYPFSNKSSWLRNWTGISCIAGWFFTNWAIGKHGIICPNTVQLSQHQYFYISTVIKYFTFKLLSLLWKSNIVYMFIRHDIIYVMYVF